MIFLKSSETLKYALRPWENIEVFQQWYASYFNYCALKRHFISAGI